MACKSLAIAYPPLRHQRRSARRRSGQHGGVNPNLRAHSPQTSNPPDPVCAFAHHRPATPELDDRQNKVVLNTPTRYMKRTSDRRFRRSEALSRTRWQVKDSNLRSSRDGFTDHRRQRAHQRKRPFHRQLTCAFPTNSRWQSTTTGHRSERFTVTTSRYDVEPEASNRCEQLNGFLPISNGVTRGWEAMRGPTRSSMKCSMSRGDSGPPCSNFNM